MLATPAPSPVTRKPDILASALNVVGPLIETAVPCNIIEPFAEPRRKAVEPLCALAPIASPELPRKKAVPVVPQCSDEKFLACAAPGAVVDAEYPADDPDPPPPGHNCSAPLPVTWARSCPLINIAKQNIKPFTGRDRMYVTGKNGLLSP